MIRKKHTLLFIISIISIGAIMQSCNTKKGIVSATAVEAKVAEDLFVDILDNQFDFNTFSSKLNINLSFGTRSLSSKSNLKIIKDQVLQLSIQPLFGVEMIRLYVDNSEVVILDRMNKRYIKEPISKFMEEYPMGFDLSTIQALLTNRVFVSGKSEIEYNDYKSFSTNKFSDHLYSIEAVDKKSGIEYRFAINSNDNVANTIMNMSNNKYKVSWAYDEFIRNNNNNKLFPHKMNIEMSTPKRKSNIGLEFSGIVLNEELNLEMSIPNGYTQASISDVVKILKPN